MKEAPFTLLIGDVMEQLGTLGDESVHCVVTSPPYWGLRDYGTADWQGGDDACDHTVETRHQAQGATSARAGRSNADAQRNENFRDECGKCGARRVDQQLGLEPTPELYVERMVAVFREVRRVLRADGTLWLNIGDCYTSGGRDWRAPDSKGGASGDARAMDTRPETPAGLKPKDLVGIPWRLAFALQADGWYLRADIIWSKPNPMPESVTDRPTKAHEYMFLLTKSARYFYDADAIREASVSPEGSRAGYAGYSDRPEAMGREASGNEKAGVVALNSGARNKRSVWEIATAPYAEAHFATFPPALVEPCVKAGTSEQGCCPECGAPWERETETTFRQTQATNNVGDERATGELGDRGQKWRASGNARGINDVRTTGWRPTCEHKRVGNETSYTPVPCVVLDPFMGSGTVALVARRLGRRSIGIELNPEYAELATKRLETWWKRPQHNRVEPPADQLALDLPVDETTTTSDQTV